VCLPSNLKSDCLLGEIWREAAATPSLWLIRAYLSLKFRDDWNLKPQANIKQREERNEISEKHVYLLYEPASISMKREVKCAYMIFFCVYILKAYSYMKLSVEAMTKCIRALCMKAEANLLCSEEHVSEARNSALSSLREKLKGCEEESYSQRNGWLCEKKSMPHSHSLWCSGW